jgi:hypothetical protein
MVGEKKTETVDPGEKKIFNPGFKVGVFLIWHRCRHLTEKVIIAAGLNQSQCAVAGEDHFGLCSCRARDEKILGCLRLELRSRPYSSLPHRRESIPTKSPPFAEGETRGGACRLVLDVASFAGMT